MINEIIKDTKARMKKSIDALHGELTKVRTGRASTALVEHLEIPCYGSKMPLSQVANVSASDARTIVITPWDKTIVSAVEKAILQSDIGITPLTAGEVIRLPLPAMTEERRRDLTKMVKSDVENVRVAIRNIRRDANAHIKELLKEKMIGEDEEKKAETEIQKITDQFIAEADKLLAAKETEIMEV